MRLWHWTTIGVVLLIASLIFSQKKGYCKVASILRKIIGIICLLGGLFFGALGLIYVSSDILAMFAIKSGKSYAEGPGLGLMIGTMFILFITTPLIAISAMLLRVRNKKV